MERVFPTWSVLNDLKQPLTSGERTLIKFLDDSLKKDSNFKEGDDLENYNGWLIFVQPFLNGCRPDIIIFNPFIGVQIIEVKDWDLLNYSFELNEKGEWEFYVHDRNGKYTKLSPIRQVEHYKEKLSGQLIPQLGEAIDTDKRKYGLIKTSVYFHKSHTKYAQELFEKQVHNFTVFPVYGYDSLHINNLRSIVPDSYLSKSYYWSKDWNKEILFWLNPPFHSLEQTTKLELNKYQKLFAEPESGHHRVRGVAGSGKTQVLAYRAGSIASLGNRVLILSFNITLWHYIKDMIQRCPFMFNWNKFTFNHFHGFCKDILNDFGEKWPTEYGDDESVFREIVPQMVLRAISNEKYEKYDAILIDEGQDYYYEWYSMLCRFLTSKDEVVVVCDKKQNIYGRAMEWLDKRRSGVEKFGNWIELKTIVRMPEGVAEITKRFSERFELNQDVRVENIERPDLFNQYIEHTVWENIEEEKWIERIDAAFELIKSNATSKHISDTVILLPDRIFGLECVNHFTDNKKIEVNHVFDKGHKKSFWMGDSRLKISTIHSFKGWEVLNVIIFIPQDFIGGNELNDRKVYTAMTRTRQNLIVLNANNRYWEFGEELPKRWK